MPRYTSASANDLLKLWTHLPGLHWVVDKNFSLVAISQDYLALIGAAKEAVLQKDIFSLFQDQPYTRLVGGTTLLRDSLEKARDTGQEISLSAQKIAKIPQKESSHQTRFFDLLYLPVMNGSQQVTHIIHQAKEVTPPDDAQKIKDIQGGSSIYRAIAANLPYGAVFVVDHDLRYILADGQALRHAGMTPVHLEGKNLSEVLDADLAQLYEPHYRQALAGELFRQEHERHGHHYTTHGTPLRNEQGEIYAVLAVSYDITERKKAEEALRKSEAKYQTLFNSIDEGFCIIEMLFDKHDKPIDYRFLEVNPAFEKQTGIHNAVGKRMREFVPNHEEHWFETYGKVALSGKSTRFIHEAKPLMDGWYDVYAFRYGSEENRQVAILFNNITQHKRVEEALRESEKHLSAIFAQAAVGISEISPDGQFIRVNDELCRMLGRSRENLLTASLSDVTHPQDVSRSISVFKHLIETGEVISIDMRYLRPDDNIVWGNSLLTRLDNAQGYPQTVLAVTVDLTERRQTEKALRQSETHLRLIMESAKDYAIITIDMNRYITDWNAGAEHILGYSKEEMIGQTADIIFTAEDRKNKIPEQEMQRALLHGQGEDERWHMRKDGSRFWGSGMMMPLLDKNKAALGFLKIMRDQTERMQMEEAFRLAKAEAEQAAHAKEEFLAHMSHEIRTPLNAVIGLSNLLLRQNPQPEQLENLQTLKFSAENLMVLVNDILDFSKIQAGKVTLAETDVNLRELMNSLRKAHQPHASEQENTLQFQIDERIPEMVRTDQLKLSQVLHNLVSNAVKFTKKGMIKVEVNLKRKKKNKLWIDFSVSDTGIGIPQDKLTAIFDLFTQADNSTVREYGGTGLGLSITKLLLELMDSHIEVESQEGVGSRFIFTLPMKESMAAGASSVETTAHQEVQTHLSHTRLLVVEDFDINRKILKQFFTNWWELTPDEAVNGQEAVAMAQKEQYDLILMDVRMPVMDGYQAARSIRNLPNNMYQKVPIIALTADTLHEIEKHPEAALFTDIITKPFDPDDLQQKLIRYAPREKMKADHSSGVSTTGVPATGMPATGMPATGVPANTPSPQVDIKKVEAFCKGNTKHIKLFLKEAIRSLQSSPEKFSEIMSQRNEQALSDLKHKLTLLLDMLALEDMKALLEQSKLLLKENAAQEQLQQIQEKQTMMVEQIVAALEEHL